MFGFCPHRGTLDALLHLEHIIQEGFNHKKFTLVAFLDLKGAFDTASHKAIVEKFASLGLFGQLLNWVKSFLTSRSFSLVIGNTHSRNFPITRGVPQGSPLSPLYLNVLLSDFLSAPHTQALLYTNVITLLCSASTIQETQLSLQSGFDTIFERTTHRGLTANAQKSSLMCFTRRHIPNLPLVTTGNSPIPFKTHHKFLGLMFDGPQLNWGHHIEYMVTTCHKRINLMKSLAGVRWSADKKTLLKFYCIYIWSRLDYRCEVYGAASPSILQKLEFMQNSALRIALAAFKSFPVTALQVESSTSSLTHRHSSCLVCTYNKIATAPKGHELHTLLQKYDRKLLLCP